LGSEFQKRSRRLSTAYVSVGANLGDKIANCRRGLSLLNRQAGTEVVAVSRTYRTAPVDFLDQDWFVNLVVKVETRLDPFGLLEVLQDIQHRIGQGPKAVRFGPRLLDLDIIFYEQAVIQAAQLVLPHPRMHRRRFVLQPLCDIDPGLVHPVLGDRIQVLLDKLSPDEQKIEEMVGDAIL
jgi:2-amino-4-hydroxy-6-hydroxymethyldihydropteridine diphosphokinase